MNSEKIFEIALGLTMPWQVEKTELIKSESDGLQMELHITIVSQKGYYVDNDGKSRIHDSVEKTWQHLNFFQHKCFIHSKVPRLKRFTEDEEGNLKRSIDLVSVPWARSGSGFTLLFESFAMLLIEQEMPVNKVGKVLQVYPNRIWTIFNYWLGIAYREADHASITELGIDETSSRKGHDYITVAVDMKERKVLHATEGKGSDTIKRIANYLEEKGTPREEISKVCIDLSPSFISGVNKEFTEADIIFDRYHVKALLNKAMDDVRKSEYKLHVELKGHKYHFLKSEKNLSIKQKSELNEKLELLPVLGKAYRLKVLFDDFWEMKNKEEASAYLAYWCDQAAESKIFPMMKFGRTVKYHWTGIVNYIEHRLSNGILEGINSKIQLAKRRARGYANKKNFINMIYLIAGKLKFRFPPVST